MRCSHPDSGGALISNQRAVLKKAVRPHRDPSTRRAALICLVDLSVFAMLLTGVVLAASVWVKCLLGALLGLSIARLFVIGHDACHQAFFESRRANRWIGRLVFLPSLTNYSLWEVGHNIGHHVYTNLRGHDHVWSPATKAEYDAMPTWRQTRERVYRSGYGMGAYYALELWWRTLLVPSAAQRARPDGIFLRDTALVAAFAALWCGGLVAAALATDQAPWLLLTCGLLLPFALWNTIMGAVIYFHHTHPDVAWFDDIDQWEAARDGCSGTVHITFPGPLGAVLNHIMQHPVHHLDVRIPLYRLVEAQAELSARAPRAIDQAFGSTHVLDCLRRCKLYDYENRHWTDFDGVATSPALVGDGGTG